MLLTHFEHPGKRNCLAKGCFYLASRPPNTKGKLVAFRPTPQSSVLQKHAASKKLVGHAVLDAALLGVYIV
jgi:hypothetical protein